MHFYNFVVLCTMTRATSVFPLLRAPLATEPHPESRDHQFGVDHMGPTGGAGGRRLRGQCDPRPQHQEPLPAQRKTKFAHPARAHPRPALPCHTDRYEECRPGAAPQCPPAVGLHDLWESGKWCNDVFACCLLAVSERFSPPTQCQWTAGRTEGTGRLDRGLKPGAHSARPSLRGQEVAPKQRTRRNYPGSEREDCHLCLCPILPNYIISSVIN